MGNENVSKPARTSPPLRVSYTQSLFTPKTFQQGQKPAYSMTAMIDKNVPEQMAWLKQLYKDAEEALAEKWPDPAKRPRIPLIGETNSLFKDGDKTTDKQGVPLKEKNPEYAGHYILRMSSKVKPFVVDRNRQEILTADEVYGGCFCKVNCNVYTYEMELNKGITCGINGVQKWAEGERFGGGRPSLESMFDAAPPVAGAAGGDPFAGAPTPVEEDPFLKM
ncbi:MAG: DUF2815 family protein [Acidithiobacillus sp.]|nr:DUF2815 family protein [Acidithiobacillus sp.]